MTNSEMIQEMIETVCDEVGFDAWHHQVDPIESKSRSGFIAFTDGGWDGVVTFGFYGETARSTKDIAPFLDRDYDQMRDTFIAEHLPEAHEENYLDFPDWEEFQSDWEQSDDTTWFVKVRAIFYAADNSRNRSGEDEWFFLLGVCDDFNYGRDTVGGWAPGVGTKWKYECNVTDAEITAELLTGVAEGMMAAWRAA